MKSSVQSNLSVSFHFLLQRKRNITAHAKVWSVLTIKVLKEIWCGSQRKIEINLCNLTFKGLLSNGFYSCLLHEYNSNRELKTSALKTA